MKIVLVDDEPLARLRLRNLLVQLGETEVQEAADAVEALQRVTQMRPDLILLDIRMPGASGLTLAAQLQTWVDKPAIVFTTAYAEFALEAFDVAAVGYLLKPVRQDKLAELLARLAPTQPARQQRQYLCAVHGREWQRIALTQILCFVSDQKYTRVCHQDGELLIEDSLKDLEQEFQPDFLRIHRNALVAINRVKALERRADGVYELSLQGTSQRLEVSRRLLPLVRTRLQSG